MRLGELLGLEWQDVDLDEGVLRVERQWTLTAELTAPKTKKGVRRVPLTPDMVSFLRRHKLASKFSKDEDFVFSSRAGTPLTHRNVQVRGFEAARDQAGLPETLSFHDMRHAFASLCQHAAFRSRCSRRSWVMLTLASRRPFTRIFGIAPVARQHSGGRWRRDWT